MLVFALGPAVKEDMAKGIFTMSSESADLLFKGGRGMCVHACVTCVHAVIVLGDAGVGKSQLLRVCGSNPICNCRFCVVIGMRN